MKYVSFDHNGVQGFGVLEGGRIVVLDGAPDLQSYLPTLMSGGATPSANAPRLPLAAVRLLPPVLSPSKIFCVATNFHEEANTDKPVPAFPLLFLRTAEAQTGHEQPILKPAHSEQFDFEGELAVIIGRPGHKIERDQAMQHVAGYSCYNDGSVRDWQRHSSQFTAGKNFYKSASFGPWLVTTNEIADPAQMTLETRVNGQIKQSVSMCQMIFDIPWLIAYISTFAPLRTGDVIVTGTPSGFGSSRTPKEFLSEGDLVEVEISGIGTLRNLVQQDQDPRSIIFS
jgi:2-keto-4-pentenoate hydratase/2-oxohepta-3-ene-1,7-dioic acid hydratase in catechol pathway